MTAIDDPDNLSKFAGLPYGAFPSGERRGRAAETRMNRRAAGIEAKLRGRKIQTRHPSVCEVCLQDVPVGTSAWWSPGARPVHEKCLPGTGVEPMHPVEVRRLRMAFEDQLAQEALADRVLGKEAEDEFFDDRAVG